MTSYCADNQMEPRKEVIEKPEQEAQNGQKLEGTEQKKARRNLHGRIAQATRKGAEKCKSMKRTEQCKNGVEGYSVEGGLKLRN